MLYAVTVEPLNSVFFLSERPPESPWRVEEGVMLDIPSNYVYWPEDSQEARKILCTSISNPKSYKLFSRSRDIDPEEYRPTSFNFGGVFSPSSWERFLESLTSALPFLAIPNDERPAPTDAAISAFKREG
jgi:hypothetical protein